MDNDSAHHAMIAFRMYQTGDFITLFDNGADYLDKPHLHFWLCALSYKIFGVTAFAYKFPSLLFTVLGTYSTYRLGRILYNSETGRLAALVLASSFGYILANNDVRMDAILTASIIFTIWQLVEFIHDKKTSNIARGALGLALGFCTKGLIALFVPAIAIAFYLLYKKEWKLFVHPKWLLLFLLFFLFISPVLYCFYLQYDLHPEKIIKGKNNISGLNFILWDQSMQRFRGDGFSSEATNDYFFFLHSFLWAFAPWSTLAYIACIHRTRYFLTRRFEWLTPGVFLVMVVVLSLSSAKLPHYLIIIFPTTAILTTSFLFQKMHNLKWINFLFFLQLSIAAILLLAAALVNAWAFPINNVLIMCGVIVSLAIVFYYFINKNLSRAQKTIFISVTTMVTVCFLMNANFYPRLLEYQAGNELAKQIRGRIDTSNIYFWKDVFSSSFCFGTKIQRNPFSDSVLESNRSVWVVVDELHMEEVKNNYITGKLFSHIDYEITQLRPAFINPASRRRQCTRLYIVELFKQ